MTTSLRSRALLLALLAWLVAAVPAAAHSELVSSIPAAGSTVTSAPGLSVVLSFSEAVKDGSKADVVGPDGTTVGTATIDPGDNTKLSWTPPKPFPPGSYTIRWTSIATDGDVLRGTIPFNVGAAAAPSPSGASSPAPGDSSAGVIVPVIAALLIIGLLASALLRNRRPTARR